MEWVGAGGGGKGIWSVLGSRLSKHLDTVSTCWLAGTSKLGGSSRGVHRVDLGKCTLGPQPHRISHGSSDLVG
jgi:hypothetical protein